MCFLKNHFGELAVREYAGLGSIVQFDAFWKFLSADFSTRDSVTLRKDNVETALKNCTPLVVHEDDGRKYCTYSSIIQFLFKYAARVSVCSKLTEEIVSILRYAPLNTVPNEGNHEKEPEPTILQLYKKVATNMVQDRVLQQVYGEMALDEKSVPTVYKVHRDKFSQKEWSHIVFFEHHFGMEYGQDPFPNYTKELSMRTEYFDTLVKCKDIAVSLSTTHMRVIKSRRERVKTATNISSFTMQGLLVHSYEKLDHTVRKELQIYFPHIISNSAIVLPNAQENSVTVSIEEQLHCPDLLYQVHSVICSCLNKVHQLDCANVLILNRGTSEGFYRKELQNYARHILRDEILSGLVSPVQEYVPEKTGDLSLREDYTGHQCLSCFPSNSPKPLDFNSFNLLREWLTDVPFKVQLIMESALNATHLTGPEQKNVLQTKLKKLYILYDTMLHTFNYKHTGIIQRANTLELIMDSKTMDTVFHLAFSSGSSLSHTSAKRLLNSRTVDELLYFNAYVKQYPISVQRHGSCDISYVNLRKCIIILMIDNLVCLKVKEDPDPGECRSKQINMLPITLQGLPCDSDEVGSWHQSDCPVEINCDCKQATTIPTEKLVPLMVTLLPEEEEASQRFARLSTWGLPSLFFQLKNFLHDNHEADEPSSDGIGTINQETSASALLYPCTWSPLMSMTDEKNPPIQTAHIGNLQKTPYTSQGALHEGGSYQSPGLASTSTSIQDMQFISTLQESPLSARKLHHDIENTPATCNTEQHHLHPLVFNMMSPLTQHSQHEGALWDPCMDESSHLESDIHLPPDADDEPNLAELLSTTIMEGYDLQQYHGPEVQMLQQSDANPAENDQNISENPSNDIGATSQPENFGFEKFVCPELLTRHPAPATGCDDDPDKLKIVLDDVLQKLGYHDNSQIKEKILFGPDHKIAQNLLCLKKSTTTYDVFMAEFPLLHIRKQNITILFAAYKETGLLQLLQFMCNKEQDDWWKLLSAEHIDTATKHIRRLSASFHIAFLVVFVQSLPTEMQSAILLDMEQESYIAAEKWHEKYFSFIKEGCTNNATFCLHFEIMQHLDDVVAVALAERLGGRDGYNLLLSALKSSLLFSFLNGAVAYAPFTMQLLLEHYQASHFHQCMKMSLFSTPRPGSKVNFSGDTKRELDHLDALRGFRPGSTTASVSKRMALVDLFYEINQGFSDCKGAASEKTDNLGWHLSETDWKYIIPTATVILRRKALSMHIDETLKNVYTQHPTYLDPVILDCVSAPGAGIYLMHRAACNLGLLGLTKKDLLPSDKLEGPSYLKQTVLSSKSTTIRRAAIKKITALQLNKSREEKEKEKRKRVVSQESKKIKRDSSRMNACPALVRPDCSKPKVQKL